MEEAQKVMMKKYNIYMQYTGCTPCKYQIEYNKAFEELYTKSSKTDIKDIITKAEEEAHKIAVKEYNKTYKK